MTTVRKWQEPSRGAAVCSTMLLQDITNHWGVVFNRSKVDDNVLQKNNDAVTSGEVSPHFYYTKYFLNGIEGSHSYKNIWVEEK